VSDLLRSALEDAAAALGHPGADFIVERPRDSSHGDLATNLALVVARFRRSSPRAVAEELLAVLAPPAGLVARTEVAGPGFINFWLSESHLTDALAAIIAAGPAYGHSDEGRGIKVNVEFVSANPTGPLHVGHGRGAALGDAISSLLEWTGHEVTREFYVNDAGAQIDRLGESLWARVQEAVGREGQVPEGGYHGEYLRENAATLLANEGATFADLAPEAGVARARARGIALQRLEQDRDLTDFGVRFDVFSSEQAVYDRGAVAAALAELDAKALTFEKDGALWFRTTDYGDDQDRVLRKSDGTYTYFLPDIAYHIDKFSRGFHRLIDVWGADHHGYIPRMRAAMRALGHDERQFEIAMVQLVKVVRSGEEVKMSKRAGTFITLRDLFTETGTDAARYFFLMRKADSHLVFDVELATRQTDENPVFYVQMAHARLSGIFRTAGIDPSAATGTPDLAGLPAPQDLELLKKLTAFRGLVSRAARASEPHRVCVYLEELATTVHGWYHHTRTVGEAAPVEQNRLLLARAARTVLANGLGILGLAAPDRM
jgi:arginyl-tRNA synthetase